MSKSLLNKVSVPGFKNEEKIPTQPSFWFIFLDQLGASVLTLLGLVCSRGVCGNLLLVNGEAAVWSGVNTGFGVKLIPDQTPDLPLRNC